MYNLSSMRRHANACLTLGICITLGVGCRKGSAINPQVLRNFDEVNLVADKSIYDPTTTTDPTLKDAWGLAWSPTGIAWVNATLDGVSELYTANGVIVRPPVNVPSPTDSVGGQPIGIVFNSTKGFVLPDKATASFIFDGGDGVISAWNGAAGNNAFRIANNSATSAYTGLALAANGGANYLYAADFRSGKIDVWDTTWKAVTWMSFRDPAIPTGFSPFNIQPVGSWLFVTYARVGANGRQATGAGEGFVDIFNTDGSFVRRFASRGTLNAPWGVTMTPAGFLQNQDMDTTDKSASESGGTTGSSNSNSFNASQQAILIGSFGDGRINVFSTSGQFLGQLQSNKQTIVINGLWALGFAPTTATTVDPDRLYFTAGPAMEADGVFGYLVKQ